MLRYLVFNLENDFIITLQTALNFGPGFDLFIQIVSFIGNFLFIEFIVSCIYLYADPILGFKTTMVTFMGIFTIILLKLMYKIP